jgi:hypothetical protein
MLPPLRRAHGQRPTSDHPRTARRTAAAGPIGAPNGTSGAPSKVSARKRREGALDTLVLMIPHEGVADVSGCQLLHVGQRSGWVPRVVASHSSKGPGDVPHTFVKVVVRLDHPGLGIRWVQSAW